MAYSQDKSLVPISRPQLTWHKVGKRDMVAYPGPEVVIPTWLFAGFIGLIAGMIAGPSIMASTKAGSERLAELSRQYIAGK